MDNTTQPICGVSQTTHRGYTIKPETNEWEIKYSGPIAYYQNDEKVYHANTVEEAKSEIDELIISELNSDITKYAGKIGSYRSSIITLQDQVRNKEAINKILFGIAFDYCSTFEAKFMSDEEEFTPEQMQQYINASMYLEVRFSRKGMHGKVADKLGSLPF